MQRGTSQRRRQKCKGSPCCSLNPCEKRAVRACSLEKLWASRKQGNQAVAYHRNWASPKFRQGVRVSTGRRHVASVFQASQRGSLQEGSEGRHFRSHNQKNGHEGTALAETECWCATNAEVDQGARLLGMPGRRLTFLPKKSLEEEMNQAVRGIHACFTHHFPCGACRL